MYFSQQCAIFPPRKCCLISKYTCTSPGSNKGHMLSILYGHRKETKSWSFANPIAGCHTWLAWNAFGLWVTSCEDLVFCYKCINCWFLTFLMSVFFFLASGWWSLSSVWIRFCSQEIWSKLIHLLVPMRRHYILKVGLDSPWEWRHRPHAFSSKVSVMRWWTLMPALTVMDVFLGDFFPTWSSVGHFWGLS